MGENGKVVVEVVPPSCTAAAGMLPRSRFPAACTRYNSAVMDAELDIGVQLVAGVARPQVTWIACPGTTGLFTVNTGFGENTGKGQSAL